MLRHGRTAWNLQRRIQGRTDTELSDCGRAELARRRLPERFAHWDWHASPLRRATETARLLGAAATIDIDARLIEMNWGEWEGCSLAELRRRYGAEMTAREALGLDFRPDGGECPREVRARLLEWLCERAGSGARLVVVTHKGVIRAALSAASGWDMRERPPLRLDWDCAHHFAFDPGRRELRLVEPNVTLERP